jgi:maltokinase
VVQPGASAALASQLLGRDLVGERPITVDQTNESVVVADEVVVKWLRPPVPTPHPGVEILTYLAAQDFPDMPAFLGAHSDDDMVYAILTQYVAAAQDGWDWFVDDVDAWLRGTVRFEALVQSAQRIGQLTADLHRALHGFRRSTIGTRTYHAKALQSLDLALRTVDGEEGERLHDLEQQVRDALEPLRGDRMLTAHRVHGDLHIGNFLRAGHLLLITDFDGNPMSDPADRRLPQSPLVDVASMLQSLDHVGRVVVHRRHPDRAMEVDQFIGTATAAALQVYLRQHHVDHDVLHALCVAQELHEYGYAVAHLPHWRYVPHAALPAVLARR